MFVCPARSRYNSYSIIKYRSSWIGSQKNIVHLRPLFCFISLFNKRCQSNCFRYIKLLLFFPPESMNTITEIIVRYSTKMSCNSY